LASWDWSGSDWGRRYGIHTSAETFDLHVIDTNPSINPYEISKMVERLDLLRMESDGAADGYFRVVGSVTAAEVRDVMPIRLSIYAHTHDIWLIDS
jgi:hypothetical protein